MPDTDWHFQQPSTAKEQYTKTEISDYQNLLIAWDFCFCRDIFFVVCLTYGCYRQWYWRCGAFYGFLIARPAQRNESIHYVPQDRSKTARKKERVCGRFRGSEPPANPHYSNKKAISLSADGFGPSGESRTHGLLNPIQARYQTALHPDVWPGVLTGDVVYYSPCNLFCQRRIFSFILFTKVFQIFYS